MVVLGHKSSPLPLPDNIKVGMQMKKALMITGIFLIILGVAGLVLAVMLVSNGNNMFIGIATIIIAIFLIIVGLMELRG